MGKFFLLKSNQNTELVKYLKDKDILIRNRSNMHGLKNCSRVTIGTENEMQTLVENIQKYFC